MRDGSRPALAAQRRWTTGVSAAIVAWSLAGLAQAQTAPAPAGGDQDAGTQALETEVRELAAEVRDLAAEVRELKAQKAAGAPQGPPPAPAQTAQAGPAPGAPPSAPPVQTPPASPPAPPHVAQNSEAPPGPAQRRANLPIVGEGKNTHELMLESPSGYAMGLLALMQFDAGGYWFHPDNPFVGPQALSNGANARRARFGVVGTTPGGWSFGFVYDAGNSQDTTPRGIETAQIVYGGFRNAAFEIGYSNTRFSLDQATRSSDITFLERATASDIATFFNAGDYRANVGARFWGDRYWVGAYFTGPTSGNLHTQTAENFGAFERVTGQVLQGDHYNLHLGFGFDQLIQAPNNGPGTPNSLTLSDQPEVRIDPTLFLNTGPMGTPAHPTTGGLVYNLETAATYRSLYWQGEYYRMLVNRAGLPNADFNAWYGQLAWSFTGDHRDYSRPAGAYLRIYPAHPFDPATHQWGAWEIAVRYDHVNLDSHFTPGVALSADPAAVDGGIQRDFTFGLNWYPNAFIRFMLDYIHVDFEKANGMSVTGAPLGVPVGAVIDALALRSQFEF